jgi:hypothetical protein
VNLIVAALFGIVMSVALALANALICSLPVMWLWNAVAPDVVLGIKPLSWVQALSLTLLCGLLFRTATYSSTSER